MSTVISVENLSKSYRLGQIGTGTFSNDLKVWWAKLRGRPNPLLKIGQQDHGNRDGEEIWALRDVSFTVQQGEVLGIIGRNGAGKSTLLKILSRVTAPTGGQVKVKGRIASLLEVGTGFHPELTGRENIYLNGAILGMSKDEVRRKFDEIVAFAEVEKFIDTPVKRYSSGMYVRLAFAVAAHLEPEILLVDEVLAVGDAAFQQKCVGKMSEVARQGRTVLFVSHNMGMINRICVNSYWFERGHFIKGGQSNDIISEYLRSTYERDVQKSNIISSSICLKQITLTANGSKNPPVVDYGTPFEISALVQSEVSSPDSSFLIAVTTNDGTRLATMNSTDIGCRMNLLPGKPYNIRWICNHNNLVPGDYYLTLDVHDRFRSPIAKFNNIIELNISSVNAPERLTRSTKNAGYLVLGTDWMIEGI